MDGKIPSAISVGGQNCAEAKVLPADKNRVNIAKLPNLRLNFDWLNFVQKEMKWQDENQINTAIRKLAILFIQTQRRNIEYMNDKTNTIVRGCKLHIY